MRVWQRLHYAMTHSSDFCSGGFSDGSLGYIEVESLIWVEYLGVGSTSGQVWWKQGHIPTAIVPSLQT